MSERGPINPLALPIADAAQLLSKAGARQILVEQIEADIAAGAPTNGDGRALACGAIIKVAGITGRIRGMKFKRPDGKSVRPSLVVLDDPQTDESARSVSQCQQRESILAGAVLGLAGPGHKISGIMPCTVIRPGDMADRILNRDHHPSWQGETSHTLVESVGFRWETARVREV